MAGDSIVFDHSTVDDALGKLLAAAGDISPALKNIGEYEAKVTRRRFIDQRDPDGQPWRSLNTLYAKTKKGPGILRGETRTLSQIIWQVAAGSVEIGSNAIYARVHNQGAVIKPVSAAALVFSMGGKTFKVKSVRIPQRRFLGFSAVDIEEITAIVYDHFDYVPG